MVHALFYGKVSAYSDAVVTALGNSNAVSDNHLIMTEILCIRRVDQKQLRTSKLKEDPARNCWNELKS